MVVFFCILIQYFGFFFYLIIGLSLTVVCCLYFDFSSPDDLVMYKITNLPKKNYTNFI